MSAETLRRAAALMRERAALVQRGFAGPWETEQCDVEEYGVASRVLCEQRKGDVTDGLDDEVAEHIASWHPLVALAVADWLEAASGRHSRYTVGDDWDDAVAVARAYLGEHS